MDASVAPAMEEINVKTTGAFGILIFPRQAAVLSYVNAGLIKSKACHSDTPFKPRQIKTEAKAGSYCRAIGSEHTGSARLFRGLELAGIIVCVLAIA